MEKGQRAPSIPVCSATMASTSRPGWMALRHHRRAHHERAGQAGRESRYYFKGGKLFGVKEPAAQFAFDDGGKLTQWLDEGAARRVCQQDEHAAAGSGGTKRAAELGQLFAPSAAEQKAAKGASSSRGGARSLALQRQADGAGGGDKVTFEQAKLKTRAEGIEGKSPAPGEGVAGSEPQVRGAGTPGDPPHLAAAAGRQQAAVSSVVAKRGAQMWAPFYLLR